MERNRLVESLLGVVEDARENLHTATIGRVEAVNDKTLDIQPVIQRTVRGEARSLPLLREVPPIFLQGGGSYSAPPVAKGDYAVVLIMERCFDRWWDGQDFKPPLEDRMHDYSDGVALVGLNPLSSAISIPDVWQENGDREHTGNRTQEGNFDLDGDQSTTGNSTVDGDLDVGGNVEGGTYSAGGQPGVTGTFTADEGATLVTVTDGIITGIA